MIAVTLSVLFVVVSVATILSLADSWIRGRSAFGVLRREQALLDAGFLPQVEASEIRLRRPSSNAFGSKVPARRTLASARRGRRASLASVQLAG